MKIIQIADYYDNRTGHPLNNISERLEKKGHDVHVYTSTIPFIGKQHNDNNSSVKITRFKGFKLFEKIIYPGLILKILFQKNPDIINSWVMGFFSTFISGYLKPIKKYPLIVTVDFDVTGPKPSLFKKPYVYIYRKIPVSLADIIVTFTKEQKEEIIKRFGFDRKKIRVIPIGIDFKKFSSNQKENLRKKLGIENKFIILNVSFLSSKKNLELALNTLKKMKSKDIIFVHVGGISDQKYKQKLDKMIIKLKLEKNIIFLGEVPREMLYDCYKMSDILLQTGFKESFCIPILEAMASGKPVLCTGAGVAKDVIENGKTGFIVKNKYEMAEKIKLLINDEILRKNIGKNAQLIANKYDWSIIIDKIENMYREIKK